MKAYFVKIYLFALVLRLLPVILAGDLGIGLDDMFQYDMLARSLTAGNGYRWYSEADLDLVSRYIPTDFIVEDYDPQGIVTSFRPPRLPILFNPDIYNIWIRTEIFLDQGHSSFYWSSCPDTYISSCAEIVPGK